MKNKKRFWSILIVLMLLLLATPGCAAEPAAETGPADTTETSHTDKEDSFVVSSDVVGFEEVASYRDGDVTYTYYRCRTTNAMYVWRQYDKNLVSKIRPYSGFTAMLDPATNGPLTYENWLAYLEATSPEAGK